MRSLVVRPLLRTFLAHRRQAPRDGDAGAAARHGESVVRGLITRSGHQMIGHESGGAPQLVVARVIPVLQ